MLNLKCCTAAALSVVEISNRLAQLTNHRTKSHSNNFENAYIEIADFILALTLINNSATQRNKNDAHRLAVAENSAAIYVVYTYTHNHIILKG